MKSTTLKRKHLVRLLRTFFPILVLLIGIAVGVANIKTLRLLFIGATGEEANIQVDTQAVLGPMPRPWRNLAQGGEDHNWRVQPILNQVKALQPEYIRIDHIYDFFEIVSRDGGTLKFDWSKMDAVVSDILATGAKPYISLSYMPPALAQNGDIVGVPTNWGEYGLVIQRTIEHFSRERGIENVVYEVWNEPDLFGGWKPYGEKNYLTLYATAAQAADRAASGNTKPFKFGGPATTALYKNWMDSLMKLSSEQKLRLDFLSWHRYDREVDAYKKDFSQIEEWVSAFPQFPNLEYHITEWGHDPKNDAGYDGGYAAAHTAAVATEMVGKLTRGFVFEIQDGKSPEGKEFWGRWGLLTAAEVGAKTKTRYRALQLIDKIGDQRLPIFGKGSWVKGMAAKAGNVVTVVLANFDPIGSHGETVPVTFTNLEQRSFVFNATYLDGTTRSAPIATSEAALKVTVPMLPNSVVLLQLTPQE